MEKSSLRNWLYHALETGDTRGLGDGPHETADLPAARLKLALLKNPYPTPADLLPLVRHFVRSETDMGRIIPVHRGTGWPQPEDWERHGFSVLPLPGETETALRVQVRPWTPDWLPGSEQFAPDTAPARLDQRRQTESVPGDPFLKAFSFTHYRSGGQRAAVRAVLATPPGGSLIVNLSTAMGKSLCGHVLGKSGFLDGQGTDGVVVVVVPTVALALDQARSYARFDTESVLSSAEAVARYAYIGGGTGNAAIRQRIMAGEQGIVFTSPESLPHSLRPTLYIAAEKGKLKALVIDEAHIVDVWGDDFRPAFQEIAGLRRALLRACETAGLPGFRTVLLSATLTNESVATLQKLFGQPEPCRMVSAVQLRPEPAYWVRRFGVSDQDEAEEEERQSPEERRRLAVLEALRHLPRPAILYVTERAEARGWFRALQEQGYRRLDCMTGDTPSHERERILDRWTRNETDLVVATAAFGLGMDKGDVRTVIHACLPETLDRFYQEVGRGGRDGNACVSLLLYTSGDMQTAVNVAAKRLITIERGRPRWQAMFHAKEILPDGRFRVDLKTPPGVTEDRLDMVSETSAGWNARTLTLMQRTGLIELDDAWTPNDDQTPRTDDAFLRTVRVVNEAHLSEDTWRAVVEPHRQAALEGAWRQREAMSELARQRGERTAECISTILSDLYRLNEGNACDVGRACGGCPTCRRQGREPFSESAEISPWPWSFAAETLTPALTRYAKGQRGILVYYDPSERASRLRERLRAFVQWVTQAQRVPQLIAPPQWWERENEPLAAEASAAPAPVFLRNEFAGSDLNAVPTLALCPPLEVHSESGPAYSWHKRQWTALHRYIDGTTMTDAEKGVARPLCIVAAAKDTPDPITPGRLWRDMLRCPQYALDTICTEQRIL